MEPTTVDVATNLAGLVPEPTVILAAIGAAAALGIGIVMAIKGYKIVSRLLANR